MGQRLAVLDKGYIELEEMMGGDQAVIRGARICYQSDGTPEANRRLIDKLMRSEPKHNTPFEHAVFRFHVKCPLFVQRQWMRHRIGTFNEKSLRRRGPGIDYYSPPKERRRKGSHHGASPEQLYHDTMESGLLAYRKLVAYGWPREVARGVLGLGVYTEFIWTVNAWSLMNWLQKRLDKAAQWEHRQYAEVVLKIFLEEMPITANAFCKNILGRQKG